MKTIEISTKSAIKKAKGAGYEEIHVIGELADRMHRAKKVTYAGPGTIMILTAALAFAPMTRGVSLVAGIAPVAALTGLEIAAIIAAASVGLTLLIAVFKDYEEISYKKGELILKKKS